MKLLHSDKLVIQAKISICFMLSELAQKLIFKPSLITHVSVATFAIPVAPFFYIQICLHTNYTEKTHKSWHYQKAEIQR